MTRREQRTIITQTGAPAVVTVEVPGTEVEQIGALGRLQARRALADATERVTLAEERLEEAKGAAAVAARTQRVAGIAAGEQVVQRELPTLVTELRAIQERLSRFAARLDELDMPIGAAYFSHRSPAFLVQQIEAWLGGITEAFPAERR